MYMIILHFEVFKGLKGEGEGEVRLLFHSLSFYSSYSDIRVPKVCNKYQLFLRS